MSELSLDLPQANQDQQPALILTIKKTKLVSLLLFIFFITLFVLWDVAVGPANSKYLTIVYVVLGLVLLLARVPFVLLKRAWVFFLFILMNFVALIFHITDSESVLNVITLVVSYLFFYYVVTGGIKVLGVAGFENNLYKYLLYMLLISLLVSPVLTFLHWPNATTYYPWEPLFSDKRLLLIVGNLSRNVGHSKAMWLMAFGAVFVTQRIFIQKTLKGNLLNIALLCLLVLGLIETKSRIALLFIAILALGWVCYYKLISFRIYALIPMIGLAAFYFTILFPVSQSWINNAVNDLQKAIPSIRIVSSTQSASISAYNGRDVLSNALLSSFAQKPWLGTGHSAPILRYGVDQNGYVAYYNDTRVANSESMLRLLVKYGIFYFGLLMTFMLVPLFRAFKGYYKDNILVISICSIILVSGLNGNIFENLYDISALFALLILFFLVVSKHDPKNSSVPAQSAYPAHTER